ncbi:hypothetical protein ACLI1A_00905 [Flavobacterium sp. RHBU_3]|uniref:hypothetical protein n=1 Tax=Flavobacterium sp. RHBU_3 TaxID=3391184 RepID=UPI003984E56B
MKKLLLIALAAAATSCALGPRIVYGANRNLTFDTREEVATFYEKKNDLNPDDLYFFESTNDYLTVLSDTVRMATPPYYGIALGNDKMVDEGRDTSTSCIGVSAVYMAAYDPKAATVANPFKGKVLRNIKGEQLVFSEAEPTVVLTGHSNFGRMLKSDMKYYKETAAAAGKTFRYVVVSLDVPRSDYPKQKQGKWSIP